MSFESFAHVPITEELLRHVWEGEDDVSLGGHRYGLGRMNKTEFPETWTREDVYWALKETLALPQLIIGNGFPYICDRTVNGVVIRVILRRTVKGIRVHAAFPLCGHGVFRNDPTQKLALPLDLYKVEE
jgi:hypothetical protein